MMNLLVAFIFSFAILLLVILAMAVGVLNGRAAIQGSCGGLNGEGCELCSGSCETKRQQAGGKSI